MQIVKSVEGVAPAERSNAPDGKYDKNKGDIIVPSLMEEEGIGAFVGDQSVLDGFLWFLITGAMCSKIFIVAALLET